MKTVVITNNKCSIWAQKIAFQEGFPLIEVPYKRFADGEIELENSSVALLEGTHIVVVPVIVPMVHDKLIWLLFLLRALQEHRPKKITVFVPYAPYARQSNALQSILYMLEVLGVSTFISGELHEPSYIPKDNLTINNITLSDQITQWAGKQYGQGQVTIVAPDQGAVERARYVAQCIQAPLIVCTKDRYGINAIRITQMEGACKTPYALIIDDIIDTGSTIGDVARILRDQHNVDTIDVFAIHGVLSGGAHNIIQQSSLRTLAITNTIEHNRLSPHFEVVDMSDYVISAVIKLLEY